MSRQYFGSFVIGLTVSSFLAIAIATAAGPPEGRENNWHQFRGPDSTGVAATGNPPTTWDEQTNIKWKVELPGKGLSSPIIWGDKIFILTAIKLDREGTPDTAQSSRRTRARLVAEETQPQAPPANLPAADQAPQGRPGQGGPGGGGGGGRRGGGFGFGPPEIPKNFHQFVVLCLDRNTGKTLWQDVAAEVVPHEAHHGTASFASASPVTDGKSLYVSFGSRGIYRYDLNGNQKWKKDFGRMKTRFSFGEGASPTLYGDTLIINWDNEENSRIYALDAETGDIKWEKERDEPTTWTTPLVVEYGGKTQVIVNGVNRARSYDLATGDIIWECGGQGEGVVPTPVVYGDLVLLMTGHRSPTLNAIPLVSTGDITGSDKITWSRNEGTPYVPSPLLYGDLLYFTKGNDAIATCLSAETGEAKFENKRLEGLSNIYASPVAANDRIYICGRDGTTLVLKKGTELEILATNHLGETVDATPAIVGKELYIRGEKHLFCIAEK